MLYHPLYFVGELVNFQFYIAIVYFLFGNHFNHFVIFTIANRRAFVCIFKIAVVNGENFVGGDGIVFYLIIFFGDFIVFAVESPDEFAVAINFLTRIVQPVFGAFNPYSAIAAGAFILADVVVMVNVLLITV